MQMLINCDHCGKEVNKRPSYIKNNKEKGQKTYCSNECKKLGQLKGEIYSCASCGKDVYRMQSEKAKSITGNVFCSKSCAASLNNTLTKSGINNPNWKEGIGSYAKLAYNTYKSECVICGFNTKEALNVHHIDEDRNNASIDNLIILCANCHSLIHYGTLKITSAIKDSRIILSPGVTAAQDTLTV